MTVKYLRSLIENEPFQRLTIHLADGRALIVPGREYLLVPPVGDVLIAVERDGAVRHIAANLVTEVKWEKKAS
jgi:hypothetical protein